MLRGEPSWSTKLNSGGMSGSVCAAPAGSLWPAEACPADRSVEADTAGSGARAFPPEVAGSTLADVLAWREVAAEPAAVADLILEIDQVGGCGAIFHAFDEGDVQLLLAAEHGMPIAAINPGRTRADHLIELKLNARFEDVIEVLDNPE